MNKYLFAILSITLFSAFYTISDIQKRITKDDHFVYEFHIDTEKSPSKINSDIEYYWYHKGKLHSSIGDIGGAILAGDYIKYFKETHQLAEKGFFYKGVKHKSWKTWYENGQLASEIEWSKGVKHGFFKLYDKTGEEIEKGYYKHGLKHGKWINTYKKDTLNFKKGNLIHVIKKKKNSKKDSLKAIVKKPIKVEKKPKVDSTHIKFKNNGFAYDFYIDKEYKTSNLEMHKQYFWYDGNEIKSTYFDIGGPVLQKQFIKYHQNNKQLAEKGEFVNGLKNGVWKSWFQNGRLSNVKHWNHGELSGLYIEFDENGNEIVKGKYKSDKKEGEWIQHQNGDTLFYKKGILIEKPVKTSETKEGKKSVFSKMKNIFKKKEQKEEETKE
ncbi:toxin-antitoxin system YwqK family antitoxin [Aureivirga marina]|uniref:toxin-antitoxin system YwqK family antitoxin n=1 Tax=Aureivirga marina TaxID=1182451 RepID=UPI0018CAA7E0|nr:hypothetical protein [Aureivirga marina]